MAVYCFIPARLESQRLPRKMLLAETGKPLIQHTWESVRQCKSIDELIIATDSSEIATAADHFGASVVMTGKHESGTSRIAEVAERLCSPGDVVVNVQGDEPQIAVTAISALVKRMLMPDRPPMGTLGTPFQSEADVFNPACVKVARSGNGFAVDFFRAPARGTRSVDSSPSTLRHLGVYAYSAELLAKWSALPDSRCSVTLSLEQLRAIHAGIRIVLVEVDHGCVGIDTREQYESFVRSISDA